MRSRSPPRRSYVDAKKTMNGGSNEANAYNQTRYFDDVQRSYVDAKKTNNGSAKQDDTYSISSSPRTQRYSRSAQSKTQTQTQTRIRGESQGGMKPSPPAERPTQTSASSRLRLRTPTRISASSGVHQSVSESISPQTPSRIAAVVPSLPPSKSPGAYLPVSESINIVPSTAGSTEVHSLADTREAFSAFSAPNWDISESTLHNMQSVPESESFTHTHSVPAEGLAFSPRRPHTAKDAAAARLPRNSRQLNMSLDETMLARARSRKIKVHACGFLN
jgi:hypothetical protein